MKSVLPRIWPGKLHCCLILCPFAIFLLCYYIGPHKAFYGDLWALQAIQLRYDWLDGIVLLTTKTADAPAALTSVVIAILLSMFFRHWRLASMFAATFAAVGISKLIKEMVARPRPDNDILGMHPDGYGFPSNHAVYAAYFGFCLVYIAEWCVPNMLLRRTIQAVLVIWMLAMGWSRVYLGAHYPSDVVAGYMLAVMVLALLMAGLKFACRNSVSIYSLSPY